ncbi:MAG TPA: molybdopterin-dependent oxidoreductase [Anaerolineales bacterium]|nr:molybdopterin-dependent oxidoreductase [Anaerolineales bacterium]
MTGNINRRDFLKIAGAGVAATAVLTGCGPASRYVIRQPYAQMPEYTYNGQFTDYATTCRECPAGCGIIVRTMQGRAIKIEGNPDHPVNKGKTCARGQAALQGLYNPDRIKNPVRKERDSDSMEDVSWDEAVNIVASAFSTIPAKEIVFLLGSKDDHLFDLVSEITSALGAPAPIRYGIQQVFDSRSTLMDASRQVFNQSAIPFFDLENADLVISFGANFLETFLSPVSFSRGYSKFRKGKVGKRGYLVQLEARLSQTAANADEWLPITPGTEGSLAMALGALVVEKAGSVLPGLYVGVDAKPIADTAGIQFEKLDHLADLIMQSEHPLFIPGGFSMGHANGLENAQAILALNVLMKNIGLPGGVFLSPVVQEIEKNRQKLNTFPEIYDLVHRMKTGKVNTLFIHGINPHFELPNSLGFKEAIKEVPTVISFSPFPDETAMAADYIFPDHTPLESWGYQSINSGSDQSAVSGSQPVVAPFYKTRGTSDFFLAACLEAGGELVAKIPYKDIVEFLKVKLKDLVSAEGFYSAPEINTFMSLFQQFGGWWSANANLIDPGNPTILTSSLKIPQASTNSDYDFFLLPYPSPILSDGSGANKPWLQETPDPTTTVTWNSWIEINPKTADELGIQDDDIIRVISEFGILEAPVYLYPAIRPNVIAIPFGQGHTAYGRYAKGRGVNPADLLGLGLNGSLDLAFADTRVRLEKTGRKQVLSRMESRMGVYGDSTNE